MARKFFVGGNWKMNGDVEKIDGIIQNLRSKIPFPNTGQFKRARERESERARERESGSVIGSCYGGDYNELPRHKLIIDSAIFLAAAVI